MVAFEAEGKERSHRFVTDSLSSSGRRVTEAAYISG
jgi:hypothetical protein